MSRVIVHPFVARAEHLLTCIRERKDRPDLTPAELWAVDWTFEHPDHARRLARYFRDEATRVDLQLDAAYPDFPPDLLTRWRLLSVAAEVLEKPDEYLTSTPHDTSLGK